MNKVVLILIGIVGAVLYLYFLNNYINDLKLEISNLEKDKLELVYSIDKQNNTILAMEVDLENKLKELEEYKLLPPEVKYKTIYKEIPAITKKSDECADIKEVLNSLKGRKL